jgi:GNAT superfamily N-acetyltransferase
MTGRGGSVHQPLRGGSEPSPASIEKLSELSPDRVGELLIDSEAAGSRIVRRLVDDWTAGANRFDRPGEALFGASMAGRLVGVCGLNVDPYAADPRVGRVRHLYVLTACRRYGVGRQLVARIIEVAAGRFDSLRLRTNNPAAARLYNAAGFAVSAEGECTHVMNLPRRPTRA